MHTSQAHHPQGVRGDTVETESVAYLFGSFCLVPSQQVLFDGGSRVSMSGRALELLKALVERPSELITKQELMDRVWPRTVVEESNLKVQIAALRKTLNDDRKEPRFVATVVGRGYRFVARVEREVSLPSSAAGESKSTYSIPALLVRPIGRLEVIAELSERLSRVRILTVAGPGGIGKTTIALSVAHMLVEAETHDVWFVNLSGVSDLNGISLAIARSIGITRQSGDISSTLTDYLQLRNKPQLIVLDCCEHVIEGAAVVTERLTAAIPQVVVLATSREPLLATGENIYRVGPLAYPTDLDKLTFDKALQYPAVELFLERAIASRGDFVPTDEDVRVIAQICRRLDGIALAIEIAATRMDAFGVRELLDLLDDRLSLRAQGRRTAPDRQKTLLATLDWSHQLLPDIEQVVFRRLGVFPGMFALEAAATVVADECITRAQAIDAVTSIVAKSLLSTDGGSATVRYHLLDTTREYARRKLSDSAEADSVARRHAEHFQRMYARAESVWSSAPEPRWLSEHLSAIDDVRAALRWAFSARGDTTLGIALTVSAIPAWMRLSSLEECRLHVEQALHRIDGLGSQFDVPRMKLYSANAAASLYTRGLIAEVDGPAAAALALAEQCGGKEYQLRALFVKCCRLIYSGEYHAADDVLGQFCSIAATTESAVAISDGNRLTALIGYVKGKHDEARLTVERTLDRQVVFPQRSQLSSNHADGHDGSRALLANILFLQGFPERAFQVASRARDDAQRSGHELTFSYVLAFAYIPIALQTRNVTAAESALITFEDNVKKHSLILYDAMARCLRGALLLERDNPTGLVVLSAALAPRGDANIGMPYPMYAAIYARGLNRFGRPSEARLVIDAALDWSDSHDELWCVPELLRIKGELLGSADALDTSGASEGLYLQAIEQARHQGALTFELRAATSLALLKIGQRRADLAESILSDVYDRFTEGFATPDLNKARTLLASIRMSPR